MVCEQQGYPYRAINAMTQALVFFCGLNHLVVPFSRLWRQSNWLWWPLLNLTTWVYFLFFRSGIFLSHLVSVHYYFMWKAANFDLDVFSTHIVGTRIIACYTNRSTGHLSIKPSPSTRDNFTERFAVKLLLSALTKVIDPNQPQARITLYQLSHGGRN